MKILVVSPHPDDETLGAGGTLLRYKKHGHQIYWLNVTDMKIADGWDREIVEHRQYQIKSVRDIYQFDGFYNLEFMPASLSSLNEVAVISAIHHVIEEVQPTWLILPGPYDAHSDHRVVYNCCMACSKTFRASYIQRITTMEIISETDYGFQKEKFEPNLFIDITNELDDKLRAMAIYDTEIEKTPFPRSLENIKALASVRGSSSTKCYAEAFQIIKQVE